MQEKIDKIKPSHVLVHKDYYNKIKIYLGKLGFVLIKEDH